MASRILSDLSVGVTPEIQEALETAVAFNGIKASQYARIALVEKLVREQFLNLTRLENPSRKNQEIQSQAAV
jgi:hypothetical protein